MYIKYNNNNNMGIKGLPKLIKDVAGDAAIRSYKFGKFKGMRISIDASLLIHQTVIAMRSTGRDMKNKKGELTSHLQGIFYKVLIFLQNHMIPIFVFDGKAPQLKNKTIEMRKKKKADASSRLEELSDSEDEEYIKAFKQTFSPSKKNILEAQILLDLMGIPYIVAPGEADVVCAWLAARKAPNGKRYVKGVCSDDSDILAYGSPYLFKDMLRFMKKNKPVKVISLYKTLDKMKLTLNQFVDMCTLIGTDYCDNIKGIGPKTAYKKILNKKTLENVLVSIEGNDGDSDDPGDDDSRKQEFKCMIEARNIFRDALSKIDDSKDFILTDDQLEIRKFQHDELIDFMCNKHNFSPSRIKNGVDRLAIYYKEMGITRENLKNVHCISNNSINKYMDPEINDIDFNSSNDDDDSAENHPPIKSKKTRSIANLIRQK